MGAGISVAIAYVFIIGLVLLSAGTRRAGSSGGGIEQPSDSNITSYPYLAAPSRPQRTKLRSGEVGFRLNPDGGFPLTLFGGQDAKRTADQIFEIVTSGRETPAWKQVTAITPLLARSNTCCAEVVEFLTEHRPKYFRAVERAKAASADWAAAGAADKHDMLDKFREEALKTLEIRPRCDLITLFEDEPTDLTLDDALIDAYGFGPLNTYLVHRSRKAKLHEIGNTDRRREHFEELALAGLARRGWEIPMELLCDRLKLATLNELLQDVQVKPMRRKSQAVERLAKLTDVQHRIKDLLPVLSLFELLPLPPEYSHVDLDTVSRAWAYHGEVAELIAGTFHNNRQRLYWRARCEEILRDSHLRDMWPQGWTVENWRNDCQLANALAQRKFRLHEYPNAPFHIGCDCRVDER